MLKVTTTVLLTGVAVLISPAPAAAQYGEPMPRNGACFYQDSEYRGRYFCAEAGQQLRTLPGGSDDRVSSIRILGRARVRVFKDTRFNGDSLQFDSDVRDLADEDFNDRISSVQVESRLYGQGRPPYGSSQDPDRIVRRAYQDILDREPDQAGLRLYRSRIIDEGWTEQQVREALRQSPEYREKATMTRPKAEAIVRNAYLAVLGREPDAGSRSYVEKVFKDKWTQRDVERELRKSPEYRNR